LALGAPRIETSVVVVAGSAHASDATKLRAKANTDTDVRMIVTLCDEIYTPLIADFGRRPNAKDDIRRASTLYAALALFIVARIELF
jgi:hypothetical protein